jgi:predicted dehydrogenase
MTDPITRRDFVRNTALATGLMIVGPGVVRSYGANEKLRMACIGAGGMAGKGMDVAMREHLLAVAEIDPHGRGSKNIQKAREAFADLKVYTDYRKLFDEQKDLDAVWVGTPDHNHFPASIRALEAGAGVYCEKPLSWSIGEARKLREVANAKKLVTQMGNQGHSSESIRLIVEYIRSGAIGDVQRVDFRMNKHWGATKYDDAAPTPANVDWDSWLGPAEAIEYHKGLHPGRWRRFTSFGTGTLGDMACHTMDGAVWALRLHEAESFDVESEQGKSSEVGHVDQSIVAWHFPKRGDLPPVTLRWYQGGMWPELPDVVTEGPTKRMLESGGGGTCYTGSKGLMVSNSHCTSMRLVPEQFMRATPKPEPTLRRPEAGHERDFIHACKNPEAPRPASPFDYAGRLTEIVLAGVLAQRVGDRLTYDMTAGRFTNSDAANSLLWRKPRKGWAFGYPG